MGCYLLLVKEEWVQRVLSTATYYTGLRKRWETGDEVLLVSKTRLGQAIVAYGTVRKARRLEDFTEEEKELFLRHGWHTALELEPLVPVDPPLPISETPIGDWGLVGRYLHGRKVPEDVLEEIMALLGR